jgi:hypothetical protein
MRKYLFAISAILLAAASLSAQPLGLVSGRPASKNFPAVENPVLFNGDDGFFIDVPPNAIRLSINLTTTPQEANIDLYARYAQQPERTGATGVVADFRSEGPTGTERIEITENSDPPLQGGRYFIAMQAGFLNPASTGFLIASIELSPGASMLTTVASSSFQNGLEDWSGNFPAPDPVIPGSQTGDPAAELDNQTDPVSNSRALRFRRPLPTLCSGWPLRASPMPPAGPPATARAPSWTSRAWTGNRHSAGPNRSRFSTTHTRRCSESAGSAPGAAPGMRCC